MTTATLPVTGDPEVDELLVTDAFALLVGMLLDQQVPMEWAFRGPATLRERAGSLDPKAIAMLVGVWLFASGAIARFRADAMADANAIVAGVLLIIAGLAAAKYADKVGVMPPPSFR